MKIIRENNEELFKILNRSQLDNQEQLQSVKSIIKDVRSRKDTALIEYTKKFDMADISVNGIEVTKQEIDNAYNMLDDELKLTIEKSAKNIRDFHILQKREEIKLDIKGGYVGQRFIPMQRVGVYVPGGRAAYPSSVLMNVIPAQVAGVKEIIMCTPPLPDASIFYMTLAAAKIAGVTKIYKVGSAWSIAAMAFGTETIPKVNKIVGPGNIYVALAKREVFGYVGIDMVAGPSEVLIIADDSARADYVAADLLSQAEHDPLASAILITTSTKLAENVSKEVDRQIVLLTNTKNNAIESIKNTSAIIIIDTIEKAIELANEIAPEHLELSIDNPEKYLPSIINAGAVFLGHYSPEPLGDYFAGPNHVLPTSSTAKFSSPLGVDDFIKRSSVIYYSKDALENVYKDVAAFASLEGLDAHANSAKIRFEDINK